MGGWYGGPFVIVSTVVLLNRLIVSRIVVLSTSANHPRSRPTAGTAAAEIFHSATQIHKEIYSLRPNIYHQNFLRCSTTRPSLV
ncbi:hypothetical protein BD769DRAFT_1516221, partial [Suillus cothurnatus]